MCVVIAFLHFSPAPRDSVVDVSCIDPEMGRNGLEGLLPMPSCVCCEVDEIGLLELLCGSVFYPFSAFSAYSEISVVD